MSILKFAWTTLLVFINSSINPVIYFVRNGEKREAFDSGAKLNNYLKP